MKKHANIPIFLPHKGCPNDCVFCNQKAITAKLKPLEEDEMIRTIETYLSTLLSGNTETIEIAFFGGSFTGIPIKEQNKYLKIAREYMDKGLIQKIRLSTRPDYINKEILENLKEFGVSTIELGVQSFDEDVLRLSNRGYSREVIYTSSESIKSYGFELGIQLMIGLPGDTYEKSVQSAKETVKIHPSVARLYPTVVLRDTELERMYSSGVYHPLDIGSTVKITKEMYSILTSSGVNVIRIGLKSTENIKEGREVVAGAYHPAFGQLVKGELIKEYLDSQLTENFRQAIFYSNDRCFSNMIGNQKRNEIFFKNKYSGRSFSFKIDNSLKDEEYKVALIK